MPRQYERKMVSTHFTCFHAFPQKIATRIRMPKFGHLQTIEELLKILLWFFVTILCTLLTWTKQCDSTLTIFLSWIAPKWCNTKCLKVKAQALTRWCSIFQSIWKSLTDHLWVSFNNLRTDFPPKQFNNCLLMLFSCTLLGSATMNTFATTSTVACGPGLPSWRAQSMGSSCQSLSWPHSSSTHSS